MLHSLSQQNLEYGVKKAREALTVTPVEKVCYTLQLSEALLKNVLLDFLLRAKGITLEGALSAGVAITSSSGSAGSEYSARITVELPGQLPPSPDDEALAESRPLWEALQHLHSGRDGADRAAKVLYTALEQRGFEAHLQSLSSAPSPSYDDILASTLNGSPATALARIAEIYGRSHGAAQDLPETSPVLKALLKIRHLSSEYLESAGMSQEALTEYREGYPI